ncbi:MAG: DsbA family oxidoreductase [Leptospiraceae bacterium]|nr:DsbA family oxidoreductase [Leptospiraceae bacterium]
MKTHIIKIEVWSDVVCPFCYMGKRKLENAFEELSLKDNVNVEWKSFLLDPTVPEKFDSPINVYEYLANRKEITLEESKDMHSYVVEQAAKLGLTYNFDKAIVANTIDSHRLLHYAKENNLQNELKEKLLYSYFTDGKNLGDKNVLINLGVEIGLDAKELEEIVRSDKFKNDVYSDIKEAQEIGVRGVPFFVFNRKYAISGAQDHKYFIDTLKKVLEE